MFDSLSSKPSSLQANPRYIEWVADINNILFAHGHDEAIDATKPDHELDFATGWSSRSVAYRILGKELIITPEPDYTLEYIISLYENE